MVHCLLFIFEYLIAFSRMNRCPNEYILGQYALLFILNTNSKPAMKINRSIRFIFLTNLKVTP